jgi:hypothetical protein
VVRSGLAGVGPRVVHISLTCRRVVAGERRRAAGVISGELLSERAKLGFEALNFVGCCVESLPCRFQR